MKNKFKIFLIFFFFLSFSIVSAQTCPLKTVGLSRSNYSGKQGEVLALQMMLANQPEIYPEGTMSGVFGPATEKAVKQVQSSSGLLESGKLDQETIDAICEYYNVCPFQTLLLAKDSPETFEIKSLQSMLTILGYYSSGVTGTFGSKLESGLMKYQKAKGRYETGLVDYDTQEDLCNSFTSLSTIKGKATTTVTTKKPVTNTFKASCYSSPNPGKVNQNINFYSSVSGGKAPYTYAWYGSGTGSKKTISRSFTNTGNYDVNLMVTDSNKTIRVAKCSVSINEKQKSFLTNLFSFFSSSNPSVKLSSNTYSVNKGDFVNISWSSNDVQSCYILSSPALTEFSGSASVNMSSKTISNLKETTMFSIMCMKGEISTFDYVTVLVGRDGGVIITPDTSTSSTSSTTTTTSKSPTSSSSSTTSSTTTSSTTTTTSPKQDTPTDPDKNPTIGQAGSCSVTQSLRSGTTAKDFSCNELTGRCVITPLGTGKYSDKSSCDSNCSIKKRLTRYSCSIGTRQCFESLTGLFGSYSNCMRDCNLLEVGDINISSGSYWKKNTQTTPQPQYDGTVCKDTSVIINGCPNDSLASSYGQKIYSAVNANSNSTADLVPFVSWLQIDTTFANSTDIYEGVEVVGDCTERKNPHSTGDPAEWSSSSKDPYTISLVTADIGKEKDTRSGLDECNRYGEVLIKAGERNVGSVSAGWHTFSARIADPLSPNDGSSENVKLTHYLYPYTHMRKTSREIKDVLRKIFDPHNRPLTEETNNPFKYAIAYGKGLLGSFDWPATLDSSPNFVVGGVDAGKEFATYFRFRCQDSNYHNIYFVSDPPNYYKNSNSNICNPSYEQFQTDGSVMLYTINPEKYLPSKWTYDVWNQGLCSLNSAQSKQDVPCVQVSPPDNSGSCRSNSTVLKSGCYLPNYQDIKSSSYSYKYFDDTYVRYLLKDNRGNTAQCSAYKNSNYSPYFNYFTSSDTTEHGCFVGQDTVSGVQGNLRSNFCRMSQDYISIKYFPCDSTLNVNTNALSAKNLTIGSVYETYDEYNNMSILKLKCNCYKDQKGKPYCFAPDFVSYTPAKKP